jgi:hypothetical protein
VGVRIPPFAPLDSAASRPRSWQAALSAEASALSERTHSRESKGLDLPSLSSPDDVIVVHVAAVYILRCADGSFYVGHTSDLQTRERMHNEGRGEWAVLIAPCAEL